MAGPREPRAADATSEPRLGRAATLGAVAAFALGWLAVWLAAGWGQMAAATAGGAVAAAAAFALALVGMRRVLWPARRLAAGMRTVLETRGTATDLPRVTAPLLGDLPRACEAMVLALRASRQANRKIAATEAAGIATQTAGLEAVLQGLCEGVLVLSPERRVMLCNRMAERLLTAAGPIGLGRAIDDLPALAPLGAALARLDAGAEAEVAVARLQARARRLEDKNGAAQGYVVMLAGAQTHEAPALPPRPEFYDFSLMDARRGDASLAERELRDLGYVVFDCEMTGLEPQRGDEIVQIGAIRVVGGRMLSGETFDRRVNPGRPIPKASVKFHGLTDADVADAPPIGAVLRDFAAFAGDAILVGHNVAFDMTFLSLKERVAGVRLDNLVLDTMLVSAMLDGEADDLSLDALCGRYGIALRDRHSALGDARITADLLLRLIDRLEACGLGRFGAAMEASDMAAKLRHRAAVVAHGEGRR